MEALLDTLNPSQKEAAVCVDKNVRIVAGAGSGKTRVLMARIEYLIDEIGIWPHRILAITFTNKAANEMKQRLTAQLGPDASHVRISTIHSLCARILREDAHVLGFPKGFNILDTDDQKSLLTPFYKEHQIDKKQVPAGQVISLISKWKTSGTSPEEAEDNAWSSMEKDAALLYRLYEEEKKRMLVMDFDDLLLNTDRLLRENETVRSKWQNRLDYLHVDEFQDVDPTQYSIIKSLTGPEAFLCVVGDPDQTIYTWRGASVNIILHFDKDFKPCHTVLLEENYRSTNLLLQASNELIACNRNRIKKNLYSSREGTEPIHLCESMEAEQEAIGVVREIKKLHKEGLSYEEMAVLYRNNYSSLAFEKALVTANIPYRIYGGIRFYDRQEVKDLLCYMRIIADPDPQDPDSRSVNLAVSRVINRPKRGIGDKSLEKLEASARKQNINLLEACASPQGLGTGPARKMKDFHAMMMDIKKMKGEVGMADLVPLILDKTGYRAMLEEQKEYERLDNIQELVNDMNASLQENPALTLEEYLQDVSLFTLHSEEDVQGVSLMTVHAAKGLEFECVFIVNLNEKTFPNERAMNESGRAGLEEERRLMYVAMTRAKEKLYLCWDRGYSFRTQSYKTPSRFIGEIPEEYTDRPKKETAKIPAAPLPSSSLAARPKKKKKSAKLKTGDYVVHKVFGKGIVLNVSSSIAQVSFAAPHGVKKIDTGFLEKTES